MTKTTKLAYRTHILENLLIGVLGDRDIFSVADILVEQVGELLDACEIRNAADATQAERDYTRVLIDHFILYKAGVDLRMGGSRCDYSAYAATKAADGYILHLDDSRGACDLLAEIHENIAKYEWDPTHALRVEERVGLVTDIAA